RGPVRHVVRLLQVGLEDQAGANAREIYRLAGRCCRGVAGRIGRVDRVGQAGAVVVVAQAGDRLPVLAQAERVVDVGRDRGGLRLDVVAVGGRQVGAG